MQKNGKVSTFETVQQNGFSYCRDFTSRIISVQLAPAVFNQKLQPNFMLEFWYKEKRSLVDFRRGPLGPHFDGFAAHLKARDYANPRKVIFIDLQFISQMRHRFSDVIALKFSCGCFFLLPGLKFFVITRGMNLSSVTLLGKSDAHDTPRIRANKAS